MGRADFLVLLGMSLGAAGAALAQERRFCEEGAECAPDVLSVRFGDPAEHDFQFAAAPGEEFDAWIGLEVFSEGVMGWSFGLAHDTSKLEVLDITTEGASVPEVFITTTILAVGDPSPGAISAVVVNVFPPPGLLLPVGDYTLAIVRYRVISLDPFVPTTIRFVNDLIPNSGSPPTATILTIEQTTRRPRTVIDGLVWGELPEDLANAAFSRGDGNADGRIDVSDVVVCARHIFAGRPVRFDCPAAVDVTADGQLNVGDPIHLITWLFLGGPPLPRPFQRCERGPTSGLGCEESNCEP